MLWLISVFLTWIQAMNPVMPLIETYNLKTSQVFTDQKPDQKVYLKQTGPVSPLTK